MQVKKIHFSSIPSTNSWCKEHACELDQSCLTIVTADEQTAGRGRFKRSWISPKGFNLYISYTFFQNQLNENLGNLPQVLVLAAHETIKERLSSVRIKWPNDLVIEKKKLGGILCEVTQVGFKWAVIVGIGINVNMPHALLQTIDRPATSLAEELGSPVDRTLLSERLHKKFAHFLQRFQNKGFTPFLTPFKNALIHEPGDRLQFHDFQTVISGTFQGINDDGSLSLQLPDGTIKRCVTGELTN